MINIKNTFTFHIIVFVFLGCANQLPPDGGPIDTTRPEIISTYPENGRLNFKDKKIIIKFDRYVDERTFEESVFISPYIEGMEFDWSGKEVEISFPNGLRTNTTYVVNIGTDVKDKYRNSLTMGRAYTLAFSTGNEINSGYIKGMVFPMRDGDDVNGVMIFAYLITSMNSDTLNPITTKPDFITQTGRSGEFFFNHIPYGQYRVFAVRDLYRNLLYNKEVDEYGVQSEVINVSPIDTLYDNVYMRLAKEDTTKPVLAKVVTIDNSHLLVDFSETINPYSINHLSISIIDTANNHPHRVIKAYPSYSSTKSMMIVCDVQDSTKTYRLTINDVEDSVGNKINLLMNSNVFRGSSKLSPDTPNVVSISIKDSVQGVELKPKIDIVFSEPLEKPKSSDFIEILDSKLEKITTKKEWLNDAVISIKPENDLSGLCWYVLSLELYKLKDWAGRNFKDSLKILHFKTLDAEELSSISGTVIVEKSKDISTDIYVAAKKINGINQSYKVAVDKAGNFNIPNMVEGRYVLQAFADGNKNGEYDRGNPYPFKYSEKLSGYSDTLKLRARWPLDGVIIKLN